MTCRLFPGVVLLVLGTWVGCAGLAPTDSNPSSEPDSAVSSDGSHTLSQEARPGGDEGTRAVVSALRQAFQRGEYDTVVQKARVQLRDSLGTVDAVPLYVLLGRAEQARGRYDQALKALQTARTYAVEDSQSVIEIDRALGEIYTSRYRWTRAASAFERVLDARPRDLAARRALAEVSGQLQNWRDAKEQYTTLVQRDSSNGRWWARLAEAEVQLGEIGSAIQHLERAHERLPQHVDVALELSRFYRSTLRPQAARRVVDTTLSYRPKDPRLWRRRADLAFDRDNFERARPAYERAVALGDSSAAAYRRIGLIDVHRRQYERALSSLQDSYRLDSTNTRTTLYLGISHLHVDHLKKASQHLERTIRREAQGPITEAMIQRGILNDSRGDIPAAVHDFKTALRVRPQRTDVYFHLATTYDEYYEEKQTAARYYRRFLHESDSTRKQLRTYAKNRLTSLRSVLHMEMARDDRDTTDEE